MALNYRMKELTAQGVGLQQKSSDLVTPSDEVTLWDTGICQIFGFCGMFSSEQYKLGPEENQNRYVEFQGVHL